MVVAFALTVRATTLAVVCRLGGLRICCTADLFAG